MFRRRKRSAAYGILMLAAVATSSQAAQQVELLGGRQIEVADYRVRGSKARLTLNSGRIFTVSVKSIRRVTVLSPEQLRARRRAARIPKTTPFDGSEGDLRLLAHRVASRHGVDPDLIEAMIEVESGFDPWAVSPKGAAGLLQLMPQTALRFGLDERSVFDPKRNIEAGVAYVRWLWQRFKGDRARVLAAYNAGENSVDRYGGIPPYRETQSYVRKVMTRIGSQYPVP